VCLLSVLCIEHMAMPIFLWILSFMEPITGAGVQNFFGAAVNFAFRIFWIIPVYFITRFINCFLWQDIADALFKLRPNVARQFSTTSNNGQHQTAEPFRWTVAALLTDVCYAITIDTFFLMQATIFSMLPFGFLSYLISTLHLSLLYALYAFEYIWFAQRCDAKARMIRIQSNVPYYIGFGLPLAIVSTAHEMTIINGCIYSTLFPFLILSAFEATPPVPGNAAYGEESKQLPVFTPVIAISEFLFGIIRKQSNFSAHLFSEKSHAK